MKGHVIGIDPGRNKAGYAVLEPSALVVTAGIEAIERLPLRLAELTSHGDVEALALGRGTNCRAIALSLQGLRIPIHLVDEYDTTRLARALYFAEHPPRGWRRLIPVGLLLPDRPIDDYAAILIARRFLARGAAAPSPS